MPRRASAGTADPTLLPDRALRQLALNRLCRGRSADQGLAQRKCQSNRDTGVTLVSVEPTNLTVPECTRLQNIHST